MIKASSSRIVNADSVSSLNKIVNKSVIINKKDRLIPDERGACV